MKPKFQLLLLFCMIRVTAHTQNRYDTSFNMGDPAPPLRVHEWIKGTAVQKYEKGKVYVIEFWATWCKPCMAAMPHLSDLARSYKNRISVVAIDVYEPKSTSIKQVKAVVAGKGSQMDFHVAVEDTNYTVRDWLKASGMKDEGIPMTFVLNGQGRVAWMGNPIALDTVLHKILNNTWNIKAALARIIFNKHLEKLDMEVFSKLHRFAGDYNKSDDLGKPDSALFTINEIVKEEPGLEYAPAMVSFTFSALLRTNPHKAYEFGKQAMVTPTYAEPAYDMIIGCIKDDSRKLNIPPEIYRLGAECYQAKIDNAPYPKLIDMPQLYHQIAAWYSLAGDKSKAIEAEQKAHNFTPNNSYKAKHKIH